MFSQANPFLIMDDVRGGVDDSDTPVALQDNQLVDCRNVDYRFGQWGCKRGGTTPLSLTGSVFARSQPALIQQDINGATAAASSFSMATTAVTGSATNDVMIVILALTVGRPVTLANFNGSGMTFIQQAANGALISAFIFLNPPVGAGTVSFSWTGGAADIRVHALRWRNVDTANVIANLFSTTNTGTGLSLTMGNNNFSPTFIGISAASALSSAIAFTGFFAVASNTGSQNTMNSAYAAIPGMKPTTAWTWNFGGGPAYGAITFGLLGSPTATGTPLVWVGTHTPTNNPLNDELWAQDVYARLDRMVNGVWQGGVPVQNYQVGTVGGGLFGNNYTTNAVSLHGKYFLALDGTGRAQDRVHVWDGSVLRFGGLLQPGTPPTVTNTGAGGSYSTERYFRIRYTQQVNGITVRRSEPTTSVPFIPSGTNSGAVITPPPLGGFVSGEGETHTEFEGSVDNVNFYVLATLTTGSPFTDLTAYAGIGTYANAGYPLSPLLATYTPMLSVRHVVADGDRLMGAGSYLNAQSDSRVYWTPLTADVGVGNDERVPVNVRMFLDLDGLYGGNITCTLPATMGGLIIFKSERVYKLLRTGNTTMAYNSQLLTVARGCFMRAATYGVDEAGQPAVYFWDQNVGPCRFGQNGFQDLGQARRRTVQRVNKAGTSTCIARVVFYPKHWLIWMAVALDNNFTPSYIFCFNARQKAITDYDGPMAAVISGTLFKDRTTLEQRPYLATSLPNTSVLVEADKGVNDDGVYFRGYFRTKAYQVGQLFSIFRIKATAIFVKAAAGVTMGVSLIRNLGFERLDKTASADPGAGANTYVSAGIDDAFMSECSQIQFEVGDPVSYVGAQLAQTWQMDQLVAKYGTDEDIVGS